MKQFFKLFHNFKTGLWTKNCLQFFKSMVDGPWHNFAQNRVPLRFQYFQYFHVPHPYPKGPGPFNLTHKIWPKWTFTNLYFVTVYAPNVGTPLTLFLRNKKEHKRLWRNREKNAPHFSLSALGIAETTSSLRSSPLTASLFGLLLRYSHLRMLTHSPISFRLPLRGALTNLWFGCRICYALLPQINRILSQKLYQYIVQFFCQK